MPQNLPSVIKSTKFKSAEIALLRESYFKDLNDNEVSLALKQCEAMDLNPFQKEVYAYKIGGRLCLVTGIAGFRKIAHRSGDYLGCKINVLEDKDQKIVSATAIVKRLVKSHVAEFEATVRLDEFFVENNPKWKTMPENQMRIRAEAAALKMAFPNIEQLSDETNIEPLVEAHDDIEVMPSYETESQEALPTEIVLPDSPGEFVIKIGKSAKAPKKIKNMKKEELLAFVKWAYAQESLDLEVSKTLEMVEKFLKVSDQ